MLRQTGMWLSSLFKCMDSFVWLARTEGPLGCCDSAATPQQADGAPHGAALPDSVDGLRQRAPAAQEASTSDLGGNGKQVTGFVVSKQQGLRNSCPLRKRPAEGLAEGWAAGAGRRAAPDAAATVLSACSGQQALKSFSVQDSAADHDPLLQLDKLIELRKRLAQSSIAASTARCCNVLSRNMIPHAASPLPQPNPLLDTE